MDEHSLLERVAREAAAWRAGLPDAPVAVQDSREALLARFRAPLPDEGPGPAAVIEELARDARGGLLGSGSPRFYGWVIGGCLPEALAADWLASAWDQNGAIYQTSPAAAVMEEVAGGWLKELLGLPESASFGMVTGCQMAHVTALAAARHRLLVDRGVDPGREGLYGAPPIRLITGSHRHESLLRAIRFLGMGTDRVRIVALDGDGRMDVDALVAELDAGDGPAIVTLMAGDLNTGAADPFPEACAAAHERGAWVHVDGAFGLWCAASRRQRHLVEGVEQADSWATDGHKWLNVPQDHGYAFVRDAEAHHAAMTMTASYFLGADAGGRDSMNWNPEWSRRARGIVTWATLRSLGRRGVERIVDRCCAHAARLVDGIGGLAGAEVLAPGRMNQGLVRFLAPDGDHDRRTDAVVERVRDGGEAWFGATTWNGCRAMRISVCNHATTDADVDRTVAAVARAMDEEAAADGA